MKKLQGLKGATDAMHYCKSMQKGGPKPIIRSMKSFDVGGTTGMNLDSNCTSDDGGGCHKGNRKANRSRLRDAGVSRKTRNRMY
jgi:hypothetical protein